MKKIEVLKQLQPEWCYPSCRRALADRPELLKKLAAEWRRLGKIAKDHEQPVWAKEGLTVGCDEVGRGPMAGPLVAAAVAFQERPFLPYLRDSKKLEAHEREALVPLIHRRAVAVAVCSIEVEELERGNLHLLSLEAMRRAVTKLGVEPAMVFIDGKYAIKELNYPQTTLVKGDDRCLSIAAASVIAKVHRDQEMVRLCSLYPGYGFSSHKGYATAEHTRALQMLGPCPIHRGNFAPVREACQGLLF